MSGAVGGELVFLPAAALLLGGMAAGGAAVAGIRMAADAYVERQLAREAAAARAAGAVQRYQALIQRVEAARGTYGDQVTALPAPPLIKSRMDPAAAAALEAEVLATLEADSRRFQAELATATTAALTAAIVGHVAGLPRLPGGPAPERVEGVRRILGRLDPGVGTALAARIRLHAADALAAPKAAGARLMEDLRYQVDTANRTVCERRRRVEELSERLIGCPGPEADELRLALVRAEDEPDPDWPALEAAVTRTVEAAMAAALQEYAARALRESLEMAGCQVEDGFDVLLARGGTGHLRLPDWDDVAVRVRLRPEEHTVHFNLIGPKDGATEAGVVEQEWCTTFDSMVGHLAARQVGLTVTARAAEGTTQLQRVETIRFPFERAEQPARPRRAEVAQAHQRQREQP